MHTNNIREANYHLNIYISIILFLILFMVGFLCNSLAVSYNGYRMPVYTEEFSLSDNRHFTFTEQDSVTYFWLTDIIPMKTRQSIWIWSIGDLIMIAAGIGIILTFTIQLKLVFIKQFKNINRTAYNKFYK